jgi:DNA-binding MarR family transcriptional regulator
MVERRDDPGDRRIWRLHLLPPALPVLDEMLGERDDVARLLTAGLSREVVQTVHQSLVAMKANKRPVKKRRWMVMNTLLMN